MARGFVTGVLWGSIAMAAGLAVLSQLAPPVRPGERAAAAEGAVAEVARPVELVPESAVADPAQTGSRGSGVAEVAVPADSLTTDMAEKAKPAVAVPDKTGAVAEAVKPAEAAKLEAAVVAEVAKPALADGAAVADAEKPAAPAIPAGNAVAEVAMPVAAAPEVAPMAEVAKPLARAAPDAGAADSGTKPGEFAPAEADVAAEAVKPAETAISATTAPEPATDDMAAAPVVPEGPQPEVPAQDAGVALAVADVPLALPEVPAAPQAPPTLAGLEPALSAPGAEAAPQPGEPLPPEPEGAKDALLAPALQPGQAEPAQLPQIAPADDPGVVAMAPEPVLGPEAEVPPKPSPASTIESNQPTLPPVKGLTDRVPKGLAPVPGVEVNALPHVGDAAVVAAVAVADLRPVARFARVFAGAAGKPLFVILLQDVGPAGMDRQELAKLPFPVSFVIDPLAPDAAAASQVYRAAGQEVVTLANGIPPGAQASDLAETFQTLSRILPESVAVIDQDLGGFQDLRPFASLVLPILQDEGRGLVTYDRGLNAADQIARRDGVPAAVIFRRLDGEGENKAVIRRYLDRAAFKAAQEGAVVVIGDTRAATVAAILEWTVEGRAASVTLAPLTAVLGR